MRTGGIFVAGSAGRAKGSQPVLRLGPGLGVAAPREVAFRWLRGAAGVWEVDARKAEAKGERTAI